MKLFVFTYENKLQSAIATSFEEVYKSLPKPKDYIFEKSIEVHVYKLKIGILDFVEILNFEESFNGSEAVLEIRTVVCKKTYE